MIDDPDYARIFTKARCIAWQEGYALVVHGTATRDLDLLAVPWQEKHCEPKHLALRIMKATGLAMQDASPTIKPCGRKTWTLIFFESDDPRWVDLSIFQQLQPPIEEDE